MYSKVFNHFQKKFDYEAYFYSVYVPLTENPKMRNNEKKISLFWCFKPVDFKA